MGCNSSKTENVIDPKGQAPEPRKIDLKSESNSALSLKNGEKDNFPATEKVDDNKVNSTQSLKEENSDEKVDDQNLEQTEEVQNTNE